MAEENQTNVTWDTEWSVDDQYGTMGTWQLSGSAVNNEGGFKNEDPLGTAIMIALFTDARLPDYMVGRYGFNRSDQREWHGNTFAIAEGEEVLGSLLWTLRRAPMNDYTCRLAEHFCAEALQPLIRQGRASDFTITARIVNKILGHMQINIRSFGSENRDFTAELYAIK